MGIFNQKEKESVVLARTAVGLWPDLSACLSDGNLVIAPLAWQSLQALHFTFGISNIPGTPENVSSWSSPLKFVRYRINCLPVNSLGRLHGALALAGCQAQVTPCTMFSFGLEVFQLSENVEVSRRLRSEWKRFWS